MKGHYSLTWGKKGFSFELCAEVLKFFSSHAGLIDTTGGACDVSVLTFCLMNCQDTCFIGFVS